MVYTKEYLTEEGSGNWNRADDWSRDMIFKPLFEARQYLKIAKFGCSNLEEEALFDDESKTKWRIRGLIWARESLEEGISNSVFAIKSQSDKEIVLKKLKEIEEMEDKIDFISRAIQDRDTTKIIINEDVHGLISKCIKRIFMEITEPFNRSDLIFTYRESFDPEEFKKKAKQRFIEGD